MMALNRWGNTWSLTTDRWKRQWWCFEGWSGNGRKCGGRCLLLCLNQVFFKNNAMTRGRVWLGQRHMPLAPKRHWSATPMVPPPLHQRSTTAASSFHHLSITVPPPQSFKLFFA